MTVWFLVVLFAVGDHWSLAQLPIEFSTQLQCSQAGIDLMIDTRSSTRLHCIEADDGADLVVIMNDNFDFGGQGV